MLRKTNILISDFLLLWLCMTETLLCIACLCQENVCPTIRYLVCLWTCEPFGTQEIPSLKHLFITNVLLYFVFYWSDKCFLSGSLKSIMKTVKDRKKEKGRN